MSKLRLKTPSGGSVAFTASEDSPLDTVVLVPTGNATMVTDVSLVESLATNTQEMNEALASSSGSASVGYMPDGIGTVSSLVQTKLRERVSVKDFGAVGDGTNEFTKILAAWTHCLATGKDLYFPAGTYSSGINNMPFKHPGYPATDLLDCKNITIYGDGPATVLKSVSVTGADVLNLYSVKNLHIRNLKVTAELTGFDDAGSNGLSIVGGFDNLSFDNIWLEDLPYVQKAEYLDGGKGFSIQTGTPTTLCGTIKATNIFAKNCVYGFDFSPDLDYIFDYKPNVSIEGVVEKCYVGVVFGPGQTNAVVPVGASSGFCCDAKVINCQRGVILSRFHGGDHSYYFMSSETAAQKRLNGGGGVWNTLDSVVDGFTGQYVHNLKAVLTGYVGDVEYKFSIGGTSGGTSDGRTVQSDFYVDLGGVASVADVRVLDFGGNTTYMSRFYFTNSTTVTALPVALYVPSLLNTITQGPNQRLVSPSVVGSLNFVYTDGITSYNSLERDSLGMWFKQTGGSSNDIQVMGVKNHSGVNKFAIRNDGYIATGGHGGASAVGTLSKVMPIYNIDNTLLGYVPVHTTYTP